VPVGTSTQGRKEVIRTLRKKLKQFDEKNDPGGLASVSRALIHAIESDEEMRAKQRAVRQQNPHVVEEAENERALEHLTPEELAEAQTILRRLHELKTIGLSRAAEKERP
jgi:hypothetical protein